MAPPGMPKTTSAPTCSSDETRASAPVCSAAAESVLDISGALPRALRARFVLERCFQALVDVTPVQRTPSRPEPGVSRARATKNPRCPEADEGASTSGVGSADAGAYEEALHGTRLRARRPCVNSPAASSRHAEG